MLDQFSNETQKGIRIEDRQASGKEKWRKAGKKFLGHDDSSASNPPVEKSSMKYVPVAAEKYLNVRYNSQVFPKRASWWRSIVIRSHYIATELKHHSGGNWHGWNREENRVFLPRVSSPKVRDVNAAATQISPDSLNKTRPLDLWLLSNMFPSCDLQPFLLYLFFSQIGTE